MRFFKKTNIDFMSKRRTYYIVSLCVIVVGMLSIPLKGGLDYGIDFTGGTEVIARFQNAPDLGDIRSVMDGVGLEKIELKSFGDPNKMLIRTQSQGDLNAIRDKIDNALHGKFQDRKPEIIEVQQIGAKVGGELRKDAFYAILFSLIAMLIYVGFRFKFIYGIGAVVALFHDVLVTLGVISLVDGLTPLTNFEIDQNMIAAFLTIVGLSVNDTVVIFDRIRENQKIYRSMSLSEVINKSLNETLNRTVITSGTVFIVTMVLYLFGGEVNRGFAFAMTIGIITGTYSSVYIASAIVVDYTTRRQAKKLGSVTHAGKPQYETVP